MARLGPEDITSVDGIPVTGIARTVVDLARTTTFEQGVVVADGALATRTVDRDALLEATLRIRGRRGAPAAVRVVRFADGRAENVGESRSRVAILRAGLPAPEPQWEVLDQRGRFLGQADFGWPDQLVAAEFDGRVKYRPAAHPWPGPRRSPLPGEAA